MMIDLKKIKSIVISRTDSIGDVCLTLPLAGILKGKNPELQIVFLGKAYTKPVIDCCKNVDEFWDWSEIQKKSELERNAFLKQKNPDVFIHVFPNKEIAKWAKTAGVKYRIGTSHRFFHWFSCNYKPNFTRKNSELHESQLNVKLLEPFGIKELFDLKSLNEYAAFGASISLPEHLSKLLDSGKKNVVLHPKSQGSAREWGVDNFMNLANELDENQFQVFFTGTEKEGELFRKKIPVKQNVIDLTGKLTLTELIAFISRCNSLVAASTGPLHLAGLTGVHAIGLFSMKRPTHAGRWKPLGVNVKILEEKKLLIDTQPLDISARDVVKELENSTL
jgi:heptosyltransferase-3